MRQFRLRYVCMQRYLVWRFHNKPSHNPRAHECSLELNCETAGRSSLAGVYSRQCPCLHPDQHNHGQFLCASKRRMGFVKGT